MYRPIDYLITVIQATDPDEGKNGTVTFFFTAHDSKTSSLFTLGLISGKLKVAKNMEIDDLGEYSIFVVAQDQGNPARSVKKVVQY